MKNRSILIVGLLGLCGLASANSEKSESHVIRKEAVAKRISVNQNYKDAQDKKFGLIENDKIKTKINSDGLSVSRRSSSIQSRQDVNIIQKTQSQIHRDKNMPQSSRAFWFDIYDSWVSLDSDPDNDGFYSDFTLSFDADFHDTNSSNTYANVYAKIYTSLEGGDWVHLFTSEDFTLYSTSADDYYSVSFGLNYDFPTGQYDVLIDLYEVGYSGIVVTAGPEEDYDLFGLPLEDKRFELNSDNSLITYVASDLFTDHDRDGYYTQLTLEYDIDTFDSGRIVYTEIEIINLATSEQFNVYTDNFILGNQTEFIDIDFASGYNSAYYDIKIRLFDDITGQMLAIAAQDFSSLNDLPIESEEFDHSGAVVDVHVSGGGSLGLWFGLILLMGALIIRVKV